MPLNGAIRSLMIINELLKFLQKELIPYSHWQHKFSKVIVYAKETIIQKEQSW